MKFDIEFTDLKKKGHVEATLITFKVADAKIQSEVPTVRYIIKFTTEKIVLRKMVKWGEWFPEVLYSHIPDDIVRISINEIEKFEKEKMPKY